MQLPIEYITQKVYQYAGYPKYNRHMNNYTAGCPICHEGKSWGKSRRLYYFPNKNYLYCHNCGQSFEPVDWVSRVSGLTFKEILNELKEGDYSFDLPKNEVINNKKTETLPHNSINLSDQQQLGFYKNESIIIDCLDFIKKRKIDIAINKPNTLYISLTDYIHKNRLIIPFYDYNDKIIFYQSRAIYKKDEEKLPKYLSKVNSKKSIFGLNNIDINLDYIFILEGPIDSMFVKNGIAVGGIFLNQTQEEQIEKFKFFKKIWVPDCQWCDKSGRDNTKELLNQNETVFIWPKKYEMFKDINDICKEYNLSEVKTDFFIKNSYSGLDGLLKLKEI